VEGPETLTRAFNKKRAGDILNVTVYRNGRTQQIAVRLGEATRTIL